MADIPDGIVLSRDRDLQGRFKDIWIRRALISLVAAVLVVGLLNVFGQRPHSYTAAAPAAALKVTAPTHIRGGLMFESRFHIKARRELKDAQLVLGSGWMEGMTINTMEPSPLGQGSRDGDLIVDLGHIPAGKSFLLFFQMQVNPTNIGRRGADVELYDGSKRILAVHHTFTIFP
jgi:hypothetical protein